MLLTTLRCLIASNLGIRGCNIVAIGFFEFTAAGGYCSLPQFCMPVTKSGISTMLWHTQDETYLSATISSHEPGQSAFDGFQRTTL